MVIWLDEVDESVIKWQYSDDDEIHKADIDDLIRAYEKEQGEEQEYED